MLTIETQIQLLELLSEMLQPQYEDLMDRLVEVEDHPEQNSKVEQELLRFNETVEKLDTLLELDGCLQESLVGG